MVHKILKTTMQVGVLALFMVIAAGSGGSANSFSSSSGSKYAEAARAGSVAAIAVSQGYTLIGYRSSDADARSFAEAKGCSYYMFDTKTGAVFGK